MSGGKTTGGRPRGLVWTWVRRILLGIAAVIVLGVLVKVIQVATLDWRTGRDATAAFEQQRASGDQALADLDSLLERDLGTPVTHRATGYTCKVDHRDRGWFVDHYYQECTWDRIAYVKVDDLDRLVEEYGGATAQGQRCPSLRLPLSDEDERFGYLPVRAHPAGSASEEAGSACRLPELTARASGDAFRPESSVVTEPVATAELDPASDWVVVESHVSFFRKDLGCGIGIIFCNQPMDRPAMPEVGDARGG